MFKVEQVVPQKILRMLSLNRPVEDGPASLLVTTSGISSPYKSIVKLLNMLASSDHGTTKEISSILSDLKTLITGIALKSSDPSFLKTLIDGSGLTWEHKLTQFFLNKPVSSTDSDLVLKGDLKGLTMKLLGAWKGLETVPKEEIQRFVDSLEQLQFLNHTALEEKGKLFFSFPVQWNDFFSFGQLLIGLPKNREKEEGEEVIRISFLLQMSHLGPLRADMSIVDKTIRGRFLVADPHVQSLIDKHIPELKTRFLQAGFLIHDFVCALEEIEVLERASLLEELIDREKGFINLVV